MEGDDLDAETLAGRSNRSPFSPIRGGSGSAKGEDRELMRGSPGRAPSVVHPSRPRDPSEPNSSARSRRGRSHCEERAGNAARPSARRRGRASPSSGPPGSDRGAPEPLSLRQELEIGRARGTTGKIPAPALDAIAGGRAAASVTLGRRGAPAGRRRRARRGRRVSAEGSASGSAPRGRLDRARLAGAAGLRIRRGPTPLPRFVRRLPRAALDAVYRADRGMKRGEIRDEEVLDVLERAFRE